MIFESAVFFVTDDHTGNIRIDKCTFLENMGGSWYPLKQVFLCMMIQNAKLQILLLINL